jgi:cell division protein FtsQ
MSIDPRLAERRREVAEDRARRNVGRLVKFLVAFGVAGAVVWLFLSPLMSVVSVTSTGINASTSASILADQGVTAGTPLILIRSGQVERALETDPWVRESVVELDWPQSVVVRIEERVPVAWVETDEGWGLYAVDGVRLVTAPDPDPEVPWIQIGGVDATAEEPTQELLGALEFAEGLSEELKPGAKLRTEGGGELWAEVGGYQVRLGRAVEMRQKALSLAALIREQPPAGSILTLIAPTNPAISPS